MSAYVCVWLCVCVKGKEIAPCCEDNSTYVQAEISHFGVKKHLSSDLLHQNVELAPCGLARAFRSKVALDQQPQKSQQICRRGFL